MRIEVNRSGYLPISKMKAPILNDGLSEPAELEMEIWEHSDGGRGGDKTLG